jgi:hypothetical protein
MTLLPEFRQQLLAAAAEQARPGTRGGFARRALHLPRLPRLATPVAAAASILVVIAVAAAALLTIGHTHDQTTEPATHAITAHTRAQLIGELGVLRHGHAPAKLTQRSLFGEQGPGSRRNLTGSEPIPGLVGGASLRLDRSLARVVHVDGYTVTLLPVDQRGHGTRLVATVNWPSGTGLWNARGSILAPVAPVAIAHHGSNDVEYATGNANKAIVIVPDGVARVRLSQIRPAFGHDRTPTAIAGTSGPVRDNVALVTLPGVTPAAFHRTAQTLPQHGGIFRSHHCAMTEEITFVQATARMTWLNASGAAIRSMTVPIGLDAHSSFDPPRPLKGCHRH